MPVVALIASPTPFCSATTRSTTVLEASAMRMPSSQPETVTFRTVTFVLISPSAAVGAR